MARGARQAREQDHLQAADGSPAMARSIAIVCRNLVRESSELLSIGRFELLRTLGRGGHGVVYEAYDPQRRANVALKLLHGSGPTTLYRLKREFRALAELHHPNLVALHELSVGPGEAHFTMDLIEGRDLLGHVQYIANTEADPLPRLRDAFGQLYEGVRALHRAGKLHRDLKPSNVRVTDAGRVVLLDFSLVDDAGAASEPEGTRAYMAPEQARGAACEESDWYAFGRMLTQALAALSCDRADAAALEQLALRLSDVEPERRPEWTEIRAQLGAAQAAGDESEATGFVARHAELERLGDAFARSRNQPVLVRVRGEPGAGKSALVQQFVQQLGAALVLRGRCYEREALAYKAFDCAIDELSRVLLALPEPEQTSLAQGEYDALLALFPVLGRVPWLAATTATAAEDRLAQQARGFAQLRSLLARLSERRALVIWLDDLQWADEDSGRLLGALLCEEDSPHALIVATDRTAERNDNAALEALHHVAELSPRPVPIEELELGPLSHTDSMVLAHMWLGADSVALEQWVRDARGNPRALRELALARRDSERATSFEALIVHRLQRLPPHGRRVLQLLAAAGRPLPTRVVAEAAGASQLNHAHIQQLRALGLLRAVLRNADEWLELEHERIAPAVLAGLAEAELRALHGRLVLALHGEYGSTNEALIASYLGAAMPLAAAACARVLAEQASAGLAFARAARLFEQALEYGSWSEGQLAALHHDHAKALEDSGRGLDAADAYTRAAALTREPFERARHQQRAAEHLLRNGRIEAGEALMSSSYRALGLLWPERRLTLWLAIAHQLLPAWLRGGHALPVTLHRTRAELLSDAGRAIESYDLLRAVYNAILAARAGAQADDPAWSIRSFGTRGLLRSLSLWPGSAARGIADLEQACRRAEALADPAPLGEMAAQLALAHAAHGAPAAAVLAARCSHQQLRLVSSTAPHLTGVLSLLGSALTELGRLREARRVWNGLTYGARLHGDVMTALWVHAQPMQLAVLFAGDEGSRVAAILQRAARLRAEHPRYPMLGWVHAIGSLEYALYRGAGREALQILESERRVLGAIGVPMFAAKGRLVRARARLEAASELPAGRERAALLRRVVRDARALRRGHSVYDGRFALLLLAAVARLRAEPGRAVALLGAAAAEFDACEAGPIAACVRYCQGTLLGGDAGATLRTRARDVLEREGVVDVPRYVSWLACGFRGILNLDA